MVKWSNMPYMIQALLDIFKLVNPGFIKEDGIDPWSRLVLLPRAYL